MAYKDLNLEVGDAVLFNGRYCIVDAILHRSLSLYPSVVLASLESVDNGRIFNFGIVRTTEATELNCLVKLDTHDPIIDELYDQAKVNSMVIHRDMMGNAIFHNDVLYYSKNGLSIKDNLVRVVYKNPFSNDAFTENINNMGALYLEACELDKTLKVDTTNVTNEVKAFIRACERIKSGLEV